MLQVTETTINIAGPKELYEKAFHTTLVAEEREVIKSFAKKNTATFLDSPDTALPGLITTKGTPFEQVLEGMLPRASYLMLPVEPRDEIDAGLSGNAHPDGDETTAGDGWAVFSGTSAAAPQLAGAAALIKQAAPALPPASIRDLLMKGARDVTLGHGSDSTDGPAAKTGPDTATGYGLVDAFKSVQLALAKAKPAKKKKPLISAQVILHAAAAATPPEAITSKNITAYLPEKKSAARAMHAFQQLGFETGALAGVSFPITGSARLFEETFAVRIKGAQKGITAEQHDGSEGTHLPLQGLPQPIAVLVQAIVLPAPPSFGPAAY